MGQKILTPISDYITHAWDDDCRKPPTCFFYKYNVNTHTEPDFW